MGWALYDDLLKGIPASVKVTDVLQKKWWLVKTDDNMGISMFFRQGTGRRMGLPNELTSMPLRKLAEYIKSWDFYESTLAMAAINTYYNRCDRIAPLHPRNSDSAFDEFSKEVQGKRVAVVGHFPFLEKIADVCELSILEKSPQEGDYPDSACEYILGEQDYVFITGTTLANKTLPRLLELSKNAKVIMTGPSIPLTSVMFDYGVHTLAGCLAAEPEKLWSAVDGGMEHQIFRHGAQMVQIER